jgi:hypothetical protein
LEKAMSSIKISVVSIPLISELLTESSPNIGTGAKLFVEPNALFTAFELYPSRYAPPSPCLPF